MNVDLVRGTLETVILEVVSARPMYGYEICKLVDERTSGLLALREGSLYPALHKLERAGQLTATWAESEVGRRRKYYELTSAGKRALRARREEWRNFSGAINAILNSGRAAWETVATRVAAATRILVDILLRPRERPHALARP